MSTNPLFNESELLKEIAVGNEHAFDLIFNEFYKPLCLFAFHIIHSQCVTEDLVQETLIKVWQKKDQFESITKLKSFLYVSVRNACFDELEKIKVKQKHQNFVQVSESIDEHTILQSMIQAEVVSRIFALVDTLPQQCRKVILMTFEESKKPKEIAAHLGISISTVNSQKMRGLLLLKDKLSDRDLLTGLILLLPGIWL